MTVESILRKKGHQVVTVSPAASARDAANLMRNRNIAALAVVAADTIVGVISEREIAHAVSRHGADLSTMKVKEILGRGIVTVSRDDSLRHVMSLMTKNRARHVLVIEQGKLAGIVSIGDVVKHRLGDLELERDILRDVYIAAH